MGEITMTSNIKYYSWLKWPFVVFQNMISFWECKECGDQYPHNLFTGERLNTSVRSDICMYCHNKWVFDQREQAGLNRPAKERIAETAAMMNYTDETFLQKLHDDTRVEDI